MPDLSQAAAADCDPVMAAMPVTLGGLLPRRVVPGGPSILAWGDAPSVVLQCGVTRPAQLARGSGFEPIEIGGLNQPQVGWLPVTTGNATTFTSIDRSVYFALQVPKGDTDSLQLVSQIIAPRLASVCKVASEASDPDPTLYCVDRP